MTSNLAFENRTAGAGRCYFVSTKVLPAVLCFFDKHRKSPRCGSQPFTCLGYLWTRAAEDNVWRLWIVFSAQANCYNFVSTVGRYHCLVPPRRALISSRV